MKIAILIPIKNRVSTLLKTLNSVVNQTYFKDFKNDYVIYLIDDNSTDGVLDVVKDIDKLKYIKNKHNGISSALNTGIFQIMNDDNIDYIARLDVDDEWYLNKIEIQMNFFEKNPCVDVCGTGICLLGKTNVFYGVYDETHEEIVKCIKEKNLNPFCHPSVIVNKRIFYYCGLYNDLNLRAEDFDLWKRCLHFNCKFYNIKEILMNVQGKEEDFKCMGLEF